MLPSNDAKSVHPGRDIRVSFSGASWLSKQDLALELRDGQNAFVAISLSYDARERLLTATPVHPLDWSGSYTACVSIPDTVRWPIRLLSTVWGRHCTSFSTAAQPTPEQADAQILIVTGPDNPFGAYYADILRAEGLNLVTTLPSDQIGSADIARYGVVLLATSDVSSSDAAALESWTRAGGVLIAMRPKSSVMRFMGLIDDQSPISRAYLRPSRMLASVKEVGGRQPLQIHGPANVYNLRHYDVAISSMDEHEAGREEEEAATVARLYADRDTPLPHPAATSRRVGKGHAVAFAYDLARSVIYARQGNPTWANQERDGSSPRRPNDMFYPNYLDRDLVGVPQADEHQRLLANVILDKARLPLPRFWYLPGGRRAAIVMVGDDHATKDGTVTLFDKLSALSPPGCRLDRWECLRATALLSPPTVLDPGLAEAFQMRGFEFGVHVDTGCKNQDNATFETTLREQLAEFQKKYGALPKQVSNRLHCIVWNGWTDAAQIGERYGLRFDMNYYYWPPGWIGGRPGFMTGSGMPMPFVDKNGRALGVYQAATQLVNESGVRQYEGSALMIDRALGSEQFFGAFVSHYDFTGRFTDILIAIAQDRGVALISAAQLLDWVDGRDRSTFERVAWRGSTLSFTQRIAEGAEEAEVMLPLTHAVGRLNAILCGNATVPFRTETIKGLAYGVFAARDGACDASYVAEVAAK